MCDKKKKLKFHQDTKFVIKISYYPDHIKSIIIALITIVYSITYLFASMLYLNL